MKTKLLISKVLVGIVIFVLCFARFFTYTPVAKAAKTFTHDTGGTLTTGLISYYTFETGSTDFYGSNNGTNVNSPTFASGKVGNALTLSSASSQYITVPSSVIPWGTHDLTVNFWFKLNSSGSLSAFIMDANGAAGMQDYFDGTGIDFAKPGVVSCYKAWAGKDTNWHMYTGVSRSSGTGMETYIDGVSFQTNVNTANYTDPSENIPVGAYRSGGVLQSGWYLDGKMDELGFWNKSLTTAEITDLYNGGSGNTMTSGLATVVDALFFAGD